MPPRIGPMLRNTLARAFPARFGRMYSALDNEIEVPVQVAAYGLAVANYVQHGDSVLDVGFGLGYGLGLLAEKAGEVTGLEVDPRAVARGRRRLAGMTQLRQLSHYDGQSIPFDDGAFDVVTCVDVIEHVPDFLGLIREMLRVSRRVVLISTPNRRPENTRADGKPRNFWHLREWSHQEFDAILAPIPGIEIEWNFLNGAWDGPFQRGRVPAEDTQALAPALIAARGNESQR